MTLISWLNFFAYGTKYIKDFGYGMKYIKDHKCQQASYTENGYSSYIAMKQKERTKSMAESIIMQKKKKKLLSPIFMSILPPMKMITNIINGNSDSNGSKKQLINSK